MTDGPTATEKLMEQLQAATLGDYEILAELGRGGMATVFLAHDIQLDRKVAIKVMHPLLLETDAQGMVDRFKLEARTAAGLSHPNIIPIYAVRDHGHLLWIVMKFVPGRALDSVIAEAAPLPVPMVRAIVSGVAEALDYAHRHGVVHRDVKPANIMIDLEGRPVVTDFGVAKVTDQQNLTLTGTSVGTPNYMSPEQAHAEATTGASDQYSLAVVAYEMLTGKPLYAGDSAVGVMFLHAYGDVPDRPAFGPATPPDLADALIRMLHKDPASRWSALAEALPLLRGDTPLHEAKIRSDMAAIAATGLQSQILARVSTPRSPTPRTMRAAAAPLRATVAASASESPRSRSPLVIATVAVLTAAITLMLWHPWTAVSGGAPTADSSVAAVAPPPEPVAAPAPPAAPATPPVVAVAPRDSAPAVGGTVRQLRFVTPPTTIAEGDSVALRVEVLDDRGRVISRPVTWTTSDPRTAVVRAGGTLVALASGRVTVTASADGRQGRAELEVAPMIASVLVTPSAETLAPSRSVALLATVRHRDGSEVAGAPTTWRSSDEAVAVVSSTGRVTALAPGTATITATASGRRGSAVITVATPVAAVTPPPAAAPQPPAEDAEAAVRNMVDAYARALESKDMGKVRSLFPGMSAATERQTRSALAEMNDLQVRLTPAGITVDGARAQARVTGVWTYRGGKPLDVSNLYRFEKRSGSWVIVAIE